jgi:hypothetical protein
MIQTLDLARENAALKDEVERLRRELVELVQTNRVERPSLSDLRWPDEGDTDYPASDDPDVAREAAMMNMSAGQRMGAMRRLMLIMPRHRALEYGSFAGRFASVPDCKVIVDRRVAERRRRKGDVPSDERRRGDRRSDRLDTPDALVLSVR